MENVKTPTEQEFLLFKKQIAPLIGLDLTNYKNNQMERRILSLMTKIGIASLAEYASKLKTEKKYLDEFLNMLTINVTEFFRNPEKFKELETIYLPELLKKKGSIRIWSAGCSIGAEVYSVAMILDKMHSLDKATFVASDFDNRILEVAKTAVYSQFDYKTVPDEYKKYFNEVKDAKTTYNSAYQMDSKITSKIRFEKRDLLNSNFERGFDLILCRNVVIYFTEDAKDQLYKKFYSSLNPEGLLFIGSTERINNHREIGFNLRTSFFYQK